MTMMLSFGRWFGFYVKSSYFIKIGLGIFELSFAPWDGANTSQYIDSIAKSAGRAEQKLKSEDWKKTSVKVPAGFMNIDGRRRGEIRVELETNKEKFLDLDEE